MPLSAFEAWAPRDQELALALTLHEELTCTCGGWLPETTDPKNQGVYRAGPKRRCYRCTELGRASEACKDEPHPQAIRFPIEENLARRRRPGPRRRVEVPEAAKAGQRKPHQRRRPARG